MAKVRITVKDPDGVYDAIRDAARASLKDVHDLSKAEREDLVEGRHEQIAEALSSWVEYGEYITVEFDTEAKTARVMPAKEG